MTVTSVNPPKARLSPAGRAGDKLSGGGYRMANKRERQSAILEIIESRAVSSQEDLRKLLLHRGWDVTQATLSRDLRELRLARVPTPEGARYAVTDGSIEESRAALETLLPQLFLRMESVSEMIVLRTVPGGAQPIAAALDGEAWPDILGTIGGDDTILIVCRSGLARDRVVRRLKALAGEPQ
ncbi:MAG: arginine repressor [Gemmatimonadales bacterium]